MAKVSDVQQIVTDINVETNRIGEQEDAQVEELKRLRDLLESGEAITPADLDPLLASATAVRDRLRAIGANPEEPIPPVEV